MYRVLREVERRFDELAITATMAKVIANRSDLDADDELVLEAFRRSTPELATADVGDIHDYLIRYSDEQLVGVASNIKGIAHEIRYVELENEDGDSITAILFGSPTHPDTDVLLSNASTGETWELQLKATDDSESVRNWIESHPDGQIEVSSELAERLGVESSGIANEELTADVDEFIDKALEDSTLWDHLPLLSVASVSVVLFKLSRRYHRGELSWGEFRLAALAATGWKVGKIWLLLALLSIPVVNVVTGSVIVARLILSGRSLLVRSLR